MFRNHHACFFQSSTLKNTDAYFSRDARKTMLSPHLIECKQYSFKYNQDQPATLIHFRAPDSLISSTDNLHKLVSDTLKEYPNSLIVLMSPSMKIERDCYRKIQSGHIHFACTGWDGKILPEGDLSFNAGKKSIQTVKMIPDPRLKEFQSETMALRDGVFTDTEFEIRKWASSAMEHKKYPLTALVMPFAKEGAFACEKYLPIVDMIKKEYDGNYYALLSYEHPWTKDILPGNNCITLFNKTSEKMFQHTLELGDNPATQTAFSEFMSMHFNEKLKFNEEEDELFGKYMSRYHRPF